MARVTVIMPAYNAEKFIEASVRCVLNQSFSDIELIVVNDGSPDGSPEIVQSYIDTVYSPKHNDLLMMFYINDMSIEQIAKQTVYSDRHARRLYDEAIDMVDLSINL